MEAFLPAKEVDCVIAMAGDGQDRRQHIESNPGENTCNPMKNERLKPRHYGSYRFPFLCSLS